MGAAGMRGHLIRRGERSWRLKYDLDAGPAGVRQTRYVTLKGTRAQAQAEANKILGAIAAGQHVDPSLETVAAFIERWLTTWANDNVSNKTWTRYAQLLRKHLSSRVGTVLLQKLRAADLQAVYAGMAQDGLSGQTRLHMHRVTHRMLGHARQWNVTAQNVAELVDAPHVKAREIGILTAVELTTILNTLRGRSLYPIAMLALATGLRRSELLALRWQDTDLDSGILHVERSLEQTTRGGLVFKPPKTKWGRRRVTLPPSTVAMLREHRKVQQEQRLFFGLGKAPEGALVFAGPDGSTRSPNALTKEWSLAMQKAGLRVTFHSLRHTHASTLITSGLDALTISRRMGHGSPSITLGVYGHLFKIDDHAAEILEAALTRVDK